MAGDREKSPLNAQDKLLQQPRSAQICLLGMVVLALALFISRLLAGAATPDTDMTGYFQGVQRLRAGLPLYNAQMDLLNQPFQYIYPPLVALVLLPLPSYQVAWWIWGVGSIVCWLAAPLLILHEFVPRRSRYTAGFIALALWSLFPPLLDHLRWGQVQLPLLLLLTGAWWAVRHKREWLAGALLGIAIAIKVYPVLMLAPLLARRQWSLCAVAIATAGGVLALGYTIVGWDQALVFVQVVMPEIDRALGLGRADNFALSAVFKGGVLLPDALQAALTLIVRLGLVGATMLATRRAPIDHVLAISTLLLLVVPPVIWSHYFVLLLLPWLDLALRSRSPSLAMLLFCYAGAAISSAIYAVPLSIVPLVQLLPLASVLILLAQHLRLTLARGKPVFVQQSA